MNMNKYVNIKNKSDVRSITELFAVIQR